MLLDLINEVQSAAALQALVTAATGWNGVNGIDFSNCEVSLGAILDLGNLTGGGANALNVQIEQATTTGTAGTWTPIAGMIFNQITNASTGRQVVRGLRLQQFVRANVTTISGTATLDVQIFGQRKFQAGNLAGQGGYDRSPSA